MTGVMEVGLWCPLTLGMIQTHAEFTQHNVLDNNMSEVNTQYVELPVLARIEAKIATRHGTHVQCLTEKATAAREPVMDFITLNPEQ